MQIPSAFTRTLARKTPVPRQTDRGRWKQLYNCSGIAGPETPPPGSIRRCCLAFSVGIAAFFGTFSAQAVPKDKLPSFVIPRVDNAPQIDGKMAKGEWQNAVAVSGVAGHGNDKLFPRPTTYFLSWDKDNIYLACRTWVMPDHKPRVGNRQPGSAHVTDTGLELHFKPMGKNVPKAQTDSSYKFNINALGYGGSYSRVSVGQMFKNWNPDFKTGAGMTERGSAPQGGRWLVIEMAGSVDDFNLEGPNRAGDKWRMMLGFNHLPMWNQLRIPSNSDYFHPDGYCRATLGENVPAAQIRMEKLPGPCDGRATATFQAYNPTDNEVTLNLLARYKGDKDKKLLEKTKELAVPAGETKTFNIDKKLSADPKNGSIFYKIAQGDRTLTQYFAYFKVGYPDKYMESKPRKSPFSMGISFNPVRSYLRVKGDAYYLEDPDSAKALTYEITPEDGDETLAEGRIEKPISYYYRRLLDLPPLDPGKYTVKATLHLENGKTLGPVTRNFRKRDEAEYFSEWWDNDIGNTKQVIPPFEAVELDEPSRNPWGWFTGIFAGGKDKQNNATVSVWGRDYELNALGMPSKIRSQDDTVMAESARIVAVVDGEEHVINLEGNPTFTKNEDWRVAFKGEVTGAGLRFKSDGWIEQDGLAKLNLSYAPLEGENAVTLEALRLEFPVSNEQTDCLLCVGPGGNYAGRTTKLLDSNKQGKLWSTFDAGIAGAGMTEGSFYPLVWLGSEKRGLLWWADTDKGWVPDDDIPAHEVYRHADTVVLRNNIIGETYDLTGKREITFSYMASPFRPKVDNWRYAIRSEDGTFGGPHKHQTDPDTGERTYDGWHLLTPPTDNPDKYGPMWNKFKKHADAKVEGNLPENPYRARKGKWVHNSVPLMGYGGNSDDPRIKYFGNEWGGGLYSKTQRDYYSYIIKRAIKEGGLRTIYWDIFFPKTGKGSIINDRGYKLPDGRIQPGYNGFNMRRFLMRTYAIMNEYGVAPGSQVSHASNAYLLVAAPWMDAILDGEFHKLSPDSEQDWVDGYPIDHMRSLASPHNWGTAISWMNLGAVNQEKQQEYIRLFDSWYQPPGRSSSVSYPEKTLNFGLLNDDLNFVPFWRNELVTPENEDILVSMWRLPDRVILNVFNYNKEEKRNVTLNVDFEALNLVPEKKWQQFIRVKSLDVGNREPAAKLQYDKGQVQVPALKPHTGRLIGIRRY